MSNRCWCDVLSESFDSNLRALRTASSGKPVLAVVKADAYGHWAKQAVRHMSEAWGFAVATVNEAVDLVDQVGDRPLVILSPLSAHEDAVEAIAQGIRINVGSAESLDVALRVAHSLGKCALVHMEIDTGLSRTGFTPEEALPALEALISVPLIQLEAVFTHFLSGSDSDSVHEQLRLFNLVTAKVPRNVLRHSASSSALLSFPETHMDLVRPGIAVYGVPPEPSCAGTLSLEPSLSLMARVVQVKEVAPGRGVSYGARFIAGSRTRTATLGVGYADGYPPSLANRGQVLIHGVRRRVLGSVCMDAIMVDASAEPRPQVGDIATIIGPDGPDEITALEIAEAAGTIPYDILTGIGRRVKRIYRKVAPV